MIYNEKVNKPLVAGRDYPAFRGSVKVVLHNCKNHKDEYIFEGHNAPTNALADIFVGNYGGLVNYNNFADIFNTWLGGVLLFKNQLDPSAPNNYGIPDSDTNAVVAHAGQTAIGSEGYGDDPTRGNPDNSGTVTTSNSTKLCFEWGTSQGNAAQISAIGLTHTDVGSFGAGVNSTAQKSLDPFAYVGSIEKSYTYADDGGAPFGINNNTAYSFYLDTSTSNDTTVKIYSSPINITRFKLQGGALAPLTAYKQTITATIPASYGVSSHAECYYHFDFANNALILFGVPTEGGTTLYKDVISLADGTVTHSSITVTGALLWRFTGWAQGSTTGYQNTPLSVPTKAMIHDGFIYVYGNRGTGEYDRHPAKIFAINLSNTADITEINTSALTFGTFDGQGYSKTAERFATLGGLIVHDSFIINAGKAYECASKTPAITCNHAYALTDSISAPVFGINTSLNAVAVNKLYLGTKFNLDSVISKNASQSLRVEYELSES